MLKINCLVRWSVEGVVGGSRADTESSDSEMAVSSLVDDKCLFLLCMKEMLSLRYNNLWSRVYTNINDKGLYYIDKWN